MGAYNSDIEVSETTAAKFPSIFQIIVNPRIVPVFRQHDRSAKVWKRVMIWTGATALTLGIGAVLGVAVELYLEAIGGAVPPVAALAVEVAALLSIAIWLADLFLLKSRSQYRWACFARERLRQWHFQSFLDGRFIEALTTRPDDTSDLDRRWAEMLENLNSLPAAMTSFIHAQAPDKLLNETTPYSNAEVRDDVYKAMLELRFEHQGQYVRRRLTGDDGSNPLSLVKNLGWAEALGKMALLIAVAVPAAQLSLMLFSSPPETESHASESHAAGPSHTSLYLVAICAAVISAGVRAFASGLGLPYEIESYQDYVARVDALGTEFKKASAEEKLQLMHELELEAEQELRRFLILKGRASFVL